MVGGGGNLRNLLSNLGLASNKCLEELNLACNRISSFRDILNLSQLSTLRCLSLADPHFGDNPVCKLCNYQTYVTFHLTQLKSLDIEIISDNAKRLAKAIYLKKKMYYNMRMKTLKRYATNVLKRGEKLHSYKIDPIIQSLHSLSRLQKVIFNIQFLTHTENENRNLSSSKYPAWIRHWNRWRYLPNSASII